MSKLPETTQFKLATKFEPSSLGGETNDIDSDKQIYTNNERRNNI